MARRIGGAVRIGGPAAAGRLVQPDPHRAVDHVVHSPFWVEPGHPARRRDPGGPDGPARRQGETWQGPSESAYTGALILSDLATEVPSTRPGRWRPAREQPPRSTCRRSARRTRRRLRRHRARSARAATTARSRSSCTSPTRDEPRRAPRGLGEPAVRHVRGALALLRARRLRARAPLPDERYLAVRARVAPVVVAVDPCRRRGDQRRSSPTRTGSGWTATASEPPPAPGASPGQRAAARPQVAWSHADAYLVRCPARRSTVDAIDEIVAEFLVESVTRTSTSSTATYWRWSRTRDRGSCWPASSARSTPSRARAGSWRSTSWRS